LDWAVLLSQKKKKGRRRYDDRKIAPPRMKTKVGQKCKSTTEGKNAKGADHQGQLDQFPQPTPKGDIKNRGRQIWRGRKQKRKNAGEEGGKSERKTVP